MRYLLVVGFACEIYRKKPRARIFVDDRFIDEFNIQEHKEVFSIKRKTNMFPRRLQDIENQFTIIEKKFPELKFYQLNIDKNKKDLKLCIDINNNDSNYNNGFLSKSTLIQLNFFYFFPLDEKILMRLIKIFRKTRYIKNFAWFYKNKQKIFDLSSHCQLSKEDRQIIEFKNFTCKGWNVGGSVQFTCKLVKKYGILMPTLLNSCRVYLNTFDTVLINYIYNKYQQHANQRNTD